MKIDSQRQLLALAAMAAVGLLASDRLVYMPLERIWKTRSANIAELRHQLSDGTALLQREQIISQHWEQMRTNTLPQQLPTAEQQFLKAIDAWAQRSHANITSITPQWQQDEDDYMTLNCRVEATGDLETLTRFIYAIEGDPMALKVESLELNARDNTGQLMTLGLQISGLALIPSTP